MKMQSKPIEEILTKEEMLLIMIFAKRLL